MTTPNYDTDVDTWAQGLAEAPARSARSRRSR
jgi:hypothetical protein